MAKGSKHGSWMGHPTLEKEHEHELHLAAALHEFQGGMPRQEAEKQALADYRREWHARAAAHHFAGVKASHATGNMDDAKKHHALYSLHVRALGEDPMGPVPESVRKYHGQAGDEKQRHVYSFRGHDADQFLVRPITKSECELVDLTKSTPLEALRAAANQVASFVKMDDYLAEVVEKAEEESKPGPQQPQHIGRDLGYGEWADEKTDDDTLPLKPVEKAEDKPECISCGSRDIRRIIGPDARNETHYCRSCGERFTQGKKHLSTYEGGGHQTPPREGHLRLVKKALGDLSKTLDVLSAAKAVLAQLQEKK